MTKYIHAIAMAGLLSTGAAMSAHAAGDSRFGLFPGGSHPYFSAWEQACTDAV